MQIDLSYHYLTHHVVPGPQSFSYFLAFILLVVALHIPRTTLSRWQSISLFMPAITLCILHAWYAMSGVDVISFNLLFQSILFLVLHDPWTSFEHVTTESERRTMGPLSGQRESSPSRLQALTESEQSLLAGTNDGSEPKQSPGQTYPASLKDRIPWIMTLLSSIRLNTWKIGHPSHDALQPPPPAFRSRKRFAAQALLSVVRGFLTLDLTRVYISYDPYFTDLSLSISSELPFQHLHILPAQLFRSMIIGAQAWALISQMFFLPALLPVLINACGLIPDEWSPHYWVRFFGSACFIFTKGVRGLWGGYWHQTMRWTTASPGYSISEALGLHHKSASRYAIISVSAFLLSGITHTGLVPPEPLHANVSANHIRLCVAGFFWLQPIAMMVEVFVSRVASRFRGPDERLTRKYANAVLVGLWVVTWFALCLPLLGEAGRQLGYWRVWPMPVSLWKGLRGEGWIAWPFLLS